MTEKIMCTGWRFYCVCPKHESEPDGLLIRSKRKGNRADRKELETIRKAFTVKHDHACTGSYTCQCATCQKNARKLIEHRRLYKTR